MIPYLLFSEILTKRKREGIYNILNMFSKETWKIFVKAKSCIFYMKKDYRFAKIIFFGIAKLFMKVQILRLK